MATVTFEGNTLHLEGEMPKVGQKAPAFTLTATDLSKKTLADFAGEALALITVPSLDTPVCDLEMRRFNEEAAKLPKCKVAAVSCDLPFAQARWCAAANAKNVTALSAYYDDSFGISYGVWIKELHLLARAVFVIDPAGVITYTQLVPEVTNQPDFPPVLEAIKKVI